MSSHFELADALAAAFLARPLTVEEMVDRAAQVLGERRRWIRPLAQRVAEAFSDQPRPRRATVTGFILDDPGFVRGWRKYHARLVHRPQQRHLFSLLQHPVRRTSSPSKKRLPATSAPPPT